MTFLSTPFQKVTLDVFSAFFTKLLKNADVLIDKELNLQQIRKIISDINEFLYTNYDGIGSTVTLDQEFEYLSDFHKFWEKHHGEILNPKIDEIKCSQAVDTLHNVFKTFGRKPFYELYNTFGLTPQEICQIRYFSANQDFRGTREFEDLYQRYKDDPSTFDKDEIYTDPEGFLKKIGATKLSQSDKRARYAKTAAQILIDNKIEPFDLFSFCGKDVEKVRDILVNNTGSGFGKKKADMFIRDMYVLRVWGEPKNFDKIDVASDINTIKVALRSGILRTDIPLLSSFLDIFCYQYGLMDGMNAKAWRRVWEIWRERYPEECVESPSLIDYLAYRIIGKEFCRESLAIFRCESKEHEFKWHSTRNKTCQVCYNNSVRSKAQVVGKVLPCTDKDGFIAITQSKFVAGPESALPGIKECPFVSVCHPREPEFRKLNPPKSISILGETGWETARTRRGEGGGGLMS